MTTHEANGTHETAGDTVPPCAVCAHSGSRPRAILHMTHGVSIWLCDAHGDDVYLEAEGGRRFAAQLAAMWQAAGALTARRTAALHAHTRRVEQGDTNAPGRPGSYTWSAVRREAERRFASGEAPRAVIDEILAALRDAPAVAPSLRTMQRWYAEARWLAPADPSRRSLVA